MKPVKIIRLLQWLCLLTVGTAGAVEQLSNGYTQHPDAFFRAGFWWDRNDAGWGIDLHMSGDVLVGAWATYDPDGNPVWYLGVGTEQDGRWVMPIDGYTFEDGVTTPQAAGELVFQFSDGYHATMEWTLGSDSGQYSIEPFIVATAPIAEDRTGFWFEVAAPGYGISVVTQGELTMAVMFFYDHEGRPRWVWADNVVGQSTELAAYTFRGRCPACEPAQATGVPAGHLDLQFDSETRGRLSSAVQVSGDADYGWPLADRQITILSNRASGRAEASQLVAFTNSSTLESYLEDGLVDPQYYYYPGTAVDFSPAPITVGEVATSTTNLQEQGVDEADVVKTDGDFVYSIDATRFGDSQPHEVRIQRIDRGEQTELTEVARVQVGEGTEGIDGLYLVTDRGEERPDLLIVVLGGDVYYAFDIWFAPAPWRQGNSRIAVFDVSDPTAPALLSDIELEGGGIETRRIGQVLYHVSRFQPYVESNNEDELRATLASQPLEALLPSVTINGTQHVLVDAETALLPPQPPGYRYTDLITLSAFDLNQLDQPPETVTFAGLSEAIYVSQENLYVASSRYGSSVDPFFSALTYPHLVETDVHQFSLADGQPRYVGSGIVEGALAWSGTSPSFAFSEHEGHLRVVSSSGHWQDSDHRVTVLALPDAGETGKLDRVGTMPNAQRPERLGKPGEMLYGLRYLGDRLYAVTFKKVDPLYVVDLADPADPHILGELEITGFSDYLHPLPNNLVLGFGKDAAPSEGPGDGDFAWFQGLQLSLFDVSDPASPSLVRRIDIGRRGSSSALLSDHHAFSYLPPDEASGRPARVAIPVVVHDAASPAGVSPDPTFFYAWRLTGLAMFDIPGMMSGGPDLVLQDIAVSHDAIRHPEHDSWADSQGMAARGIIDENSGYLFLRGEFYTAPWGQGEDVVGPF